MAWMISLLGIFPSNKEETSNKYCGFWITANKKMVVELYIEKGILKGKIHEIKENDDHKYDKGDIILSNLKFDKKEGCYTNGIITNGKSKASCSVSIPKSNTLQVNIKKGIIKTELSWSRVN